MSDFGH